MQTDKSLTQAQWARVWRIRNRLSNYGIRLPNDYPASQLLLQPRAWLPLLPTRLSPQMLQILMTDWLIMAREDQLPPPGRDWKTWLLLGGRGAGKTRTGAEWVRGLAEGLFAKNIALIGETYGDVREVMIEGPSGLRSIAPDDSRPHFEATRQRLVWPNGAVAQMFSAEAPDGLRGFQFDAAWADEICKWRYAETVWSNLQLALRLGNNPKQVVTTTPKPTAFIKRLLTRPSTLSVRSRTADNLANLAPDFFDEVSNLYGGTRLGRQELEGEIIEDLEGALWDWRLIEAARIEAAPELERVVLAVDPPVSAGAKADACGVILAGCAEITGQITGFVLADLTVQGQTPLQWARHVVSACERHQVDRVVVEVTQGGDLVETLLRQINANVPVKKVHASRGKILRAEPVMALYERGLVRHVGAFPDLEDEMTRYRGGANEKSPDRLDALVWALSDLMPMMPPANPSIRTA